MAQAGAAWIKALTDAKKSCMAVGGRKKIHFTFSDGKELVEEYSLKTKILCVRKWRKPTTLGGAAAWEFEVGENEMGSKPEADVGLFVSSSNPICVRKDTKAAFQWRIRNLPYPLDVYSISISEDKGQMILRTTNKKYYKKFTIPDMERAGLLLDPDAITMGHANNTLLISYNKPPKFLKFEFELEKLRDKMKASEEGDVDCATQ
eukprot:m.205973 g.205973  ORF g.205973 m.205973 type:complete len:205 (+) comp15793_c0_seq10:413-1027(+)